MEALPLEFLLIAPVLAPPLPEDDVDFLESLLLSSDSLPWWGRKWLGKLLASEIRVSRACLQGERKTDWLVMCSENLQLVKSGC